MKRPISEFMQIKNDAKITTSLDAKLETCQACDCPMVLKVHCPLDVILEREKPEHLAKLDPRCWILKEKETNQ
jgi:UV DNA damage repair endonuclease